MSQLKNFLYLSPQYPQNFSLFPQRLAEEGVPVLGVGDAPWSYLDPELKNSLRGYFQVSSLHNESEVVGATHSLIQKYGPIMGVESNLETWLELEARIRSEFSLLGWKPSEISHYKRKSGMKDILHEAKVPIYEGEKLTTLENLLKFSRKVGFPLIVKPDVGVGAAGTHKIHSTEEAEEAFYKLQGQNYFVEPFIIGTIETFDGLTNLKGEIIFHTSHRYSSGVREIIQEEKDFHFFNCLESPTDIVKEGKKTVKAFNIRGKFFHIEFFRTPEGKLKIIEANLRPPGGFTTDMFNFSANIDLYRVWAKVTSGSLTQLEFTKPYCVAHVSRRKNRPYQYSHSEIVRFLGEKLCHFAQLDSIYAMAMGDYAYIIRSNNEQETNELASLIQKI